MTTEEQIKQDLLTIIQVRNQRIAELELDKLSLVRNQCKGECNNGSRQVQKTESKEEKKVFGEKEKIK
tara:strand:- start:318 stop:521 length:204 start_codon:yes stop_codon:yes gene_type:complete